MDKCSGSSSVQITSRLLPNSRISTNGHHS